MASGTVKFFNSQKGFGFISRPTAALTCSFTCRPSNGPGMRGLVEGQKVTFDIVSERGKTAASNLQVA